MKVKIYKSDIKGSILIPSSKSYSHRYLIASMLSDNQSKVDNIILSEDIKATLSCLSSFGCFYEIKDNSVVIFKDKTYVDNPIFSCNESGSTLRFLIPIVLTKYEKVTFIGSKKLIDRGISVYEKIFEKDNIKVVKNDNSIVISGKLKGGHYLVDGSVSSQFITGLLFALPLLKIDSTIEIIKPIESKNYIDMTLDVLNKFKIKYQIDDNIIKIKGNQKYIASNSVVEADYSNASFIDAFNYLGGNILLKGLNKDSLQGDKVYKNHFETLSKQYATINIENCIDLGPVLMVFAAMFNGAHFTKTNRLKIKESDRALAIKKELEKVNVKVDILDDEVIVYKAKLNTPTVPFYSHNDHRIAMALSMISAKFDIEIECAEAVNKSYPHFYMELERLGVKIDYDK